MTIRNKLLIMLIAISVLPLIILSSIRLTNNLNTIEKLHQNRLRSITHTSASAFDEIVTLKKEQTLLIASNSLFKDYANVKDSTQNGEKQKARILNEITQQFKTHLYSMPSIYDIVFLDQTGQVIASNRSEVLGFNLGGNDYYQKVRDNKNASFVYFSNAHDPLLSDSSSDRYYALSKSLWNTDGNLIGVVVTYIKQDSMAHFNKNINFGDTGISFVIDANNYILYHPETRFYNSHTSASKLSNLLRRYKENEIPKQGLIEDVMDGKPRIYYYEVMNNLNLVFLVRQDYTEYYLDKNSALIYSVLGCIVIALIAVVTSITLSKSFVQPIIKLKDTFSSSDEKSHNISDLPKTVELRDMANSYNKMITKLESQFEQIENEQVINEYNLHHDRITGLFNRIAFEKQLANELISESSVGIFYIDINDFKRINEAFGHSIGDSLLSAIGNIFTTSNLGDLYARISSDEFVISKKGTKDEMQTLSKKIQDLFLEPIILGDISLYIFVSIGIALYPEHGNTFDNIITNADIAMREARKSKVDTCLMYNIKMREKLDRQNTILQILQNCIRTNELFLMYQPIYDLSSKKLVGFEALSRIKCKQLGIISPVEFIPLAESNFSLIDEIGIWVIEDVCRFINLKKEHNPYPVYVSVNVSTLQLDRKNFAHEVIRILKKHNIETNLFHIEVQASIIRCLSPEKIDNISILRDAGIKIALDNYSAKDSSLHHLTHSYFDLLKIESSLYRGIAVDEQIKMLNSTIVQIAHKFNFTIVAKGVEDSYEHDALSSIGYDSVQGFLFSRPLMEEDALSQKFS